MSEMTNEQFLEKVRACTSPSQVMTILTDSGVELSDEQLEMVAGGVDGWSFEQFAEKFGDLIMQVVPVGFDISSIWGSLPTGGMH